MNTVDRDFIERQPTVKLEPDAEYTCRGCDYHATVASAEVSELQPFTDKLAIRCGGLGSDG
jgi:hypothetical protein